MTRRAMIVSLYALLLLVMVRGGAAQDPSAAGAGAYAGSNACKTCHADIWLNFYKNPHFKSVARGDLPPSLTGCESCHGPAAAHVAAHGGKATIPNAFSLMSQAKALEACLSCHGRDFQQANIRRSEHSMADVACTSCHSIHHSPTPKFLLATKQTDLCYGCHAAIRARQAADAGNIAIFADVHDRTGTPIASGVMP